EEIEDYKKAGKVSAEALEFGAKLIKTDASILEVVKKIESFIKEKDCGFAFPVNVSMNAAAAHDTAYPGEERKFTDEVVKLDLGAHADGFIGDNAVTVDLSGKYADLVKASREALDNVSKILQIGVTLGEIGKTVEETVQSRGYEPIRNLSGHQLAQYTQHFGLSVPNYDTGDKTELEKGMVIAIEPFATTGKGMITEKGDAAIFAQIAKRPVRNPMTRKVLVEIEKHNGLPFASRWLTDKIEPFRVKIAFRDLLNNKIIRGYPPLVEKTGGIVSQAEHTFLIDDKVTVLTRL
ncbi:type II methionyl aminopeptidase, partial [Thermoproteota archaeon]